MVCLKYFFFFILIARTSSGSDLNGKTERTPYSQIPYNPQRSIHQHNYSKYSSKLDAIPEGQVPTAVYQVIPESNKSSERQTASPEISSVISSLELLSLTEKIEETTPSFRYFKGRASSDEKK